MNIHTLKSHYTAFAAVVSKSLQSPLLLLIRLYWGWQLMMIGWGKLSHIDNAISFFVELDIVWPTLNAYMAAFVECVGGFCLLIGLFSRLAAIPIAIVMVVAYATAHRAALLSLFSDPDTFMAQSPFLFLYTALVILAFGPGKFSVDQLLLETHRHIDAH